MPLNSLADLERRIRRLEMEADQSRHKFVIPERKADTTPPLHQVDHGALTGLADDDHTQYLNTTRHDVTGRHTLGTIVPHDDHGTLTGLGDNDHPQYVLASAIGIWLDWTPTQTGWTALPTGTYRYCLIGKICFITIDQSAGTSNGTTARLTLPFSVKSGAFYGGSNGLCINNGTLLTVATKYYITSATHTIEFATDMASGVFVSSGTKRIRVEAFYEIA